MKKSQNKHLKILPLAVLPLAATIYNIYSTKNTSATNYSPYCVSDTCHQAADAAEAAAAEAAKATNEANNLQGEIDKLNADINQLQAEIAQNKAMVEDLKKKIQETTAKLTRQRAALAKLSVKIYHSDADTQDAVEILAGSESISDLAETENRQTTVSEQITKAAKKVNETKKELEAQQVSARETLKENENKAAEISTKRNQQNELKAKYEGDANAYNEAAKAATATMQAEMKKRADEISRNNSNGKITKIVSGNGAKGWWGTNTYSYAARCPQQQDAFIDAFTYYGCECTSYAAWKAYEKWHVRVAGWHNASNWGAAAARSGYRVDNIPEAYSIAYSTSGVYGHVMWVESVNADGTINLTEYNNSYSSGGHSGDFGARQNVGASQYRYIHFN